jgi:hypothetical protein
MKTRSIYNHAMGKYVDRTPILLDSRGNDPKHTLLFVPDIGPGTRRMDSKGEYRDVITQY